MTDAALGAVSPPGPRALARDGRGAAALQAVAADAPAHLNLLLLLRLRLRADRDHPGRPGGGGTFGRAGPPALVTAGAMTVVSFVVVGVAPRTVGRQHAYPVGPGHRARGAVAGPGAGPLATLLILVGNAVTPGHGFREGAVRAPEVELRELVDLAEQRGVVEHGEREMIHSVFQLGDTSRAR